MNEPSHDISSAIRDVRERLLEHPVYARLVSMDDLRTFMETHVFAVWDFMSLLKALQVELTCVSVPWLPPRHPEVARMVNEIVLGEETDVLPGGGAASHFELYLMAMKEAGADTEPVTCFLNAMRDGLAPDEALEAAGVPEAVRRFVKSTFCIIDGGDAAAIASAFTYGREDLIPEMFGEMVAALAEEGAGRLETFRYYLQRHIELDGDEHGEMGRRMVALLCGDDPLKHRAAVDAAVSSLEARIGLWDAVLAEISGRDGA